MMQQFYFQAYVGSPGNSHTSMLMEAVFTNGRAPNVNGCIKG